MGGALKILALGLFALFALGTIAGAVIPSVAPAAMTMSTMDGLFGVGRYEDTARCDFWVVNLTLPAQRIERSFDCGFFWDWTVYDGGDAYVHEVLLDREKARTFAVPHMARGNLEEWYHVDGHMLTDGALRFTLPGRADAGVLMPPPGARDSLIMGWVESGGARDGPERLVVPRELREVGEENVAGIDTVRWASSFSRVPARWHGYDVYLSEEVELASDPRTAWILEMHRHVTVEMTPAQMLAAFGVKLPLALGHLEPVMELDYRTVPAGTETHREDTLFFQKLVTPIEHAREILGAAGVGTALFGSVGLVAVVNGRQKRGP